MGEKRAYKARKPGGGRKKLKPEYDAGKNLKEQMDAAVALYNSEIVNGNRKSKFDGIKVVYGFYIRKLFDLLLKKI